MNHNQQKTITFPPYTTGVLCDVLFGVEIFNGATLIYSQEGVLNEAINAQGASIGVKGNVNTLDVTDLEENIQYTYNLYVKDSCVLTGSRQDLIVGYTFTNIACCDTKPTTPPVCKVVVDCLSQTAEDLGSTGGIVTYNAITNQINFTTPTVDTDFRLTSPHFGVGAPAGFNRLFFDLLNVVSGLVTVDYLFVDVPDSVETVTTITNTVTGHKIADYTNENGILVQINETITSFTNLVSGHKIADYVDENGTFNPISESITPLVDNLDGTYTYADEQGVQTTFDTKSLTICELEGNGLLGTEIKIKDSFYDSVNIADVTGNITQTDETLDVEEAFVVKDGCKLKVFVNKPMGLLEFTGGDLTLTDLQNKAFVEISIDDTLTANIDINTWFASCTNKFEGQQITVHCNDDLTTFDITYTRTTLAHTDTIIIDQQAMFFSFTVVNKSGILELKLN